jgi:hypothetical protein
MCVCNCCDDVTATRVSPWRFLSDLDPLPKGSHEQHLFGFSVSLEYYLGVLESRAMTTSLLWVSRESAHADSDDFKYKMCFRIGIGSSNRIFFVLNLFTFISMDRISSTTTTS